jgi:hypothetical protein
VQRGVLGIEDYQLSFFSCFLNARFLFDFTRCFDTFAETCGVVSRRLEEILKLCALGVAGERALGERCAFSAQA